MHWRLADSPSAASYYGQAKAGARFDLSGDVGHITSPTLVIHGSEDRYVPPANARALAEAIPSAKLRVIEEAGHLVFIERFADVNREVVRFLKSTGRRPARETGDRPARDELREPVREPAGWLCGAMGVLRGWAARAKAWIGVS